MEVSRDDLPELRSIFVKIFDPDMSPLGFDAKEMYQFISRRFAGTSGDIQVWPLTQFFSVSFL